MTLHNLFDAARGLVSRRRTSYVMTFKNGPGFEVLEDLARFCRAGQTPFHPNQRLNDIMIGRHEVWMRIQQHLQLSDDELWALFAPKTKE